MSTFMSMLIFVLLGISCIRHVDGDTPVEDNRSGSEVDSPLPAQVAELGTSVREDAPRLASLAQTFAPSAQDWTQNLPRLDANLSPAPKRLPSLTRLIRLARDQGEDQVANDAELQNYLAGVLTYCTLNFYGSCSYS